MPGEFHGQNSPGDLKKLDMTEQLTHAPFHQNGQQTDTLPLKEADISRVFNELFFFSKVIPVQKAIGTIQIPPCHFIRSQIGYD